jgi:isoleucyl-tRNA synthetase
VLWTSSLKLLIIPTKHFLKFEKVNFKEYKQLNLPKVAEEILEQWKADDTFSKSITNREGQPPFIFTKALPRPTVCRVSIM